MEWLSCIRKTISYVEEHLLDGISMQDLASNVNVSPFFLQKGFSLMTGYGIGEYIRNRRLYEAALELKNRDIRVIDAAFRYGYNTPESFTKAFTRFHGVTPQQVKGNEAGFRTFLPLRIEIRIKGGEKMDYRIEKMEPFRLIGFEREFSAETSYGQIPLFWDEITEKYSGNISFANSSDNAMQQAVIDNGIGEFGVCIDDLGPDRFRYLIAGRYSGGEIPEGLSVYEFPGGSWAVFDCYGPIPEAFQALNTRIFTEWLPDNPDYELSGNSNIEWYDTVKCDTTARDYHSAIWIPVKEREKK
ncbi:MAG: AraC family transcriptional regulator [Erysipelotrichaceae bacterium]|nr:AraC family transcriptional regulator [Erysipelotrichaceae bacterium]